MDNRQLKMDNDEMKVQDASGSYQSSIVNYQLKDGYKQTEVGVIPEEWQVTPLAEIAEIIDGDRGVNYPSASDFSNEGYCLFLNAGNVTKEGFRFLECMFITKEKDLSLNKGKLSRWDIVLTTRGTVGNLATFDDSVPFENIRVNSGMVLSRNRNEHVDNRYFYTILRSRIVGSQVDKVVFGSAQPQLTVKVINSFRIPVPPSREQRAIAAALSDVDALIVALDKLIAKKRAIKTAAMQQLLTGKQRLPGFSGEWEVKRLGDICQIISGGTPSTSVAAFWDGGISWCTPSDITAENGKYLYKTERTISEQGLKKSSAVLLPKGALLLCSRATVGEVKIATTPVCTNQGFKSLVCSENANNEFIYYKLLTLKQKLLEKGVGSTFLEVSKKDVGSLEIELPRIGEQTAIADILSDMDAEITALQARRGKTQAIKQGMMQELLTGRTRLV